LAGGDLLTGSIGDDILHGAAGNDTINGGNGADTINGGADNDSSNGGFGFDELSGGAGVDTFVYNFASQGTDSILDFVSGTDKLEISASGFGGGLTTGMNPLLVFGSSASAVFGSAAERFHYDTSTGMLYFDPDGTGTGAIAVTLAQFSNGVMLQASDLIIAA
jgi:Ca2+-binding RTX toxin-like protein